MAGTRGGNRQRQSEVASRDGQLTALDLKALIDQTFVRELRQHRSDPVRAAIEEDGRVYRWRQLAQGVVRVRVSLSQDLDLVDQALQIRDRWSSERGSEKQVLRCETATHLRDVALADHPRDRSKRPLDLMHGLCCVEDGCLVFVLKANG